VPAKARAKFHELIAIIEPEKGLACFLVDGEPRAKISGLVGDFDGTHVCSRRFADYPHDFPTIGLDRTGINV
jgi:hypothetical protein